MSKARRKYNKRDGICSMFMHSEKSLEDSLNLLQFLTSVVSVTIDLRHWHHRAIEKHIYRIFFMPWRKYCGHTKVRMSNLITRRVKDIPVWLEHRRKSLFLYGGSRCFSSSSCRSWIVIANQTRDRLLDRLHTMIYDRAFKDREHDEWTHSHIHRSFRRITNCHSFV